MAASILFEAVMGGRVLHPKEKDKIIYLCIV